VSGSVRLCSVGSAGEGVEVVPLWGDHTTSQQFPKSFTLRNPQLSKDFFKAAVPHWLNRQSAPGEASRPWSDITDIQELFVDPVVRFLGRQGELYRISVQGIWYRAG
jgi:hypothetical protein